MWLYESLSKFILEAASGFQAERTEIKSGRTTRRRSTNGEDPPVIVAAPGKLSPPYPMLEGRHRQPLPRIPGSKPVRLKLPEDKLEAWLVPWRAGPEKTMVVTVKPDTKIVLDIASWSEPKEHRPLRRAAKILEAAPVVFATESSTSAAYERLNAIWNDETLEKGDPLGELLTEHAKKLVLVLEALRAHPRAVLRTEQRMIKLQDVRRTNAKTLRWLSAQPGRNTAERAGARQRIKAPKSYESIATLENRVLLAFAALTVRETKR